MMLVISVILAVLPLLGVAYIVVFGSPFTVDGLFMSLILLAISGMFGLNILLEGFGKKKGSSPARAAAASADLAGLIRRGKVQSVNFYEANVGQANKSLVTLLDGANSQMVVLEGDVRNALPVGQIVEIAMGRQGERTVLLNIRYV